jgi:plastocyanin
MIRPARMLALLLAAAPAAAGDHVVSQKGQSFQPAALTIRKGDQVLFRNDDEVTHNVYSKSAGAEFNVRLQEPGTTSPVRFDQPGSIEVRCAIHPKMKLRIEVQD